jgi:hypothetical protein
MKTLLRVAILVMLIGGASGCRIGQCWREAWCSRLCPQRQQAVIVADPCVMSDPCCGSCSAPAPMMMPAQ